MTEYKWIVLNPNINELSSYELLPNEINGIHSYLVEYYKECKCGNIIIGHELQTTLEQLISYIAYPKENIRFNLETSHKRIKFIETQIKHFEAPFAGKPFTLALFQKAYIEALFGFSYFDDVDLHGWVRLFQETILLIGRKNGKTPFMAAITLADWFCGESGQKIMCASNDYEQAGIIFDCINNFREESSTVSKVTRANIKGIFFGDIRKKRKKGKFSWKNKGNIKKMSSRGKAREGRNLKMVVVDEVHEMEENTMILQLQTSLSTQDNPLYAEITTEGIVQDGYLDKRLIYCRKVLKGEIEDIRILIWLYSQDESKEVYLDETTWTKSNPALGICKKWSYLKKQFQKALESKQDRAFILAKEFNIKQLSNLSWLEEEDIINVATFSLEEFRGCYCIAGADLAETNDLAAISFLFMKDNDSTKYIHTMYFVTSYKAGDSEQTDSPNNKEKKNYTDWKQEGYCRIIEGNELPDDCLADYAWELFKEYGIRPFRVGYDQWRAKEFAKRIVKNFGEQVPVKIPMNTVALNTPMHSLGYDMHEHKVNYQNNPICKWNFGNTAMSYDSQGRIMPTKIKGYVGNKIDGTVSKIICYATLRENRTEFIKRVGK